MGLTYFILDWDDTIFPTSHRIKGEFRNFTEKDISDNRDLIFDKIDLMACTMVSAMLEEGFVSIVTNASDSWFKKSLVHMPLLSRLIETRDIAVFTANSAMPLKKRTETNLKEAKKINFDKALQKYSSEKTLMKCKVNLVSIGDQIPEIEAAFKMSTKYPYLRSKCLKLKPFPVVDIIEYQLIWIRDRLKSISKMDKKFEVIHVFVDDVQNLKNPD